MAKLKKPRRPRRPSAYRPARAFSSKRPVKKPGKPATPATPAPQPMVDPNAWQDPNYWMGEADAWKAQQNSNTDLIYKRDAALRDAGYTIDANSGQLKQIDFSLNPYSRAALMKKAYDQSLRGNVNGAAAQGQLYAGSLDRAQAASSSNYTAQQNALLNSLYDLMAETEAGLAGNQANYSTALANAGLSGLNSAQQLDLTQMGEETPGTKGSKPVYGRSPRSYQKQINRIRKRRPKSSARANKIKRLTNQRNAAINALRSNNA